MGVAYQGEFCKFNVYRLGLNDMKGALSIVTGVFFKKGISIEHTYTGIDDISVVLNQNQLKGHYIIGDIYNALEKAVGGTTQVDLEDNLGLLVAAGKGLKRNLDIPPKMWSDLLVHNIPVLFQTQGDQRKCTIYGIYDAFGEKAVNLIYDKFIDKN